MTNQWTERIRPGRAPGRRGSGGRRAAGLLLGLVALLVGASQAFAAEVVEVRVGRHPDFTRIVFELDRAAGYRIERSAGGKNAELIVSLEAGSIPRRIQSTQSFIDQVVVEPSGGRSVARIRLARSGLKLKEMILASPPRIVLDVIADQDEVTGNAVHTAATSSAARPSTNKSAATPTPKAPTPTTPAPKPVATLARTDVKPEVKPEAKTPPPAPTSKMTKLTPSTPTLAANAAPSSTTSRPGADAKPSMPTTSSTPSTSPTPGTKLLASTAKPQAGATSPSAANGSAPTATPDTTSKATPTTPQATPPTTAQTTPPPNGAASAAGDEWNDGGALAQNDAGQAASPGSPGANPAATPAAADGAQPPRARPMMVKSSSGDDEGEGGGLMTWALAGLGVAVVGFGGLVIARRRRAAAEADDEGDAEERSASPFDDASDVESEETEEEDAEETEESEEDEDAEEEEEEERPARSESRNPFASLMGSGSSKPAAPAASPTRPARVAEKQEKKPSESLLFDDAEEKTMEGMEVISRSQVNESLGGPMPMMGGASEELTQMFREMQRRVAALEGRIDELVDARDRLERQVAAQTEELRVQRAAIARTQRAVRNLSTREEAGDDEPTEPALREPN